MIQTLQGPLSGMMKSMISGKYTYLTYLMCSTSCAFMWLSPNQHKIRRLKPIKTAKRLSANDIEMEF